MPLDGGEGMLGWTYTLATAAAERWGGKVYPKTAPVVGSPGSGWMMMSENKRNTKITIDNFFTLVSHEFTTQHLRQMIRMPFADALARSLARSRSWSFDCYSITGRFGGAHPRSHLWRTRPWCDRSQHVAAAAAGITWCLRARSHAVLVQVRRTWFLDVYGGFAVLTPGLAKRWFIYPSRKSLQGSWLAVTRVQFSVSWGSPEVGYTPMAPRELWLTENHLPIFNFNYAVNAISQCSVLTRCTNSVVQTNNWHLLVRIAMSNHLTTAFAPAAAETSWTAEQKLHLTARR